jgi:hypothetical protein
MNKSRLDKPLFYNGQSMKDLKKQTPCGCFKAKDKVYIENSKSVINGAPLSGIFIFDSYDSYDNTCFIIDQSLMTYKVLYSDLIELKN